MNTDFENIKKLDPVGSLLSCLFNYVFEGQNFANSNPEINKFAFAYFAQRLLEKWQNHQF